VRVFSTGKVHGSLARAGKVRGQTPKVEKQEKKKKKIGKCGLRNFFEESKFQFIATSTHAGRALRRMQYNRRFVNVAVGPGGRRRGPNSNADKA
jgi:small subunit ribosomal protein S30e